MEVHKIVIGKTLLIHNEIGKILVLGLSPHCGDYCVTYSDGWVYLKNCKES